MYGSFVTSMALFMHKKKAKSGVSKGRNLRARREKRIYKQKNKYIMTILCLFMHKKKAKSWECPREEI